MPNDVADWTSSVVIQSGTVTISGTASVSITGTPTVQLTGNPQVQISNTPAVTISSGTVTIGNANIAVINSAGTNLQVAQSQVAIGNTINGATNFNIDPRWHAIGVHVKTAGAVTLSIKGATSGVEYVPPNFRSFTAVNGTYFAFPVVLDNGTDSQITVTASASGMTLVGILDAGLAPTPAQLAASSPPWLVPNQTPILIDLAPGNNQVVIAGVAGQKIYLFGIQVSLYVAGGAGSVVAFKAGSAGTIFWLAAAGGAFVHEWNGFGAALPAGLGLFMDIPAGANVAGVIGYSQA